MYSLIRLTATVLTLLLISACAGRDPGPLAGKWRLVGPLSMVVEFRSGETEAMGIIEKVSYETQGNEVVVTYESGPMKGSAVRYTVTGPNSVSSGLGRLERVR